MLITFFENKDSKVFLFEAGNAEMTEIGSYLFTKLMAAGINPVEALQRYDNQLYLDEAVITAVGPTLGTKHGTTAITYTPATATTSASISFKNGETKVEIWDPQKYLSWMILALKADGYGINDEEKSILSNFSIYNLYRFYQDTKLAIAMTENRFPGHSSDDNNCPNAYKHAVLAALRAGSLDETRAQALTDAHEGERNQNPIPLNTQMDLANNAIGIGVGLSNYRKDIETVIYNLAITHQLVQLGGGVPPTKIIPSCPN